jgi:hypothetical protein
MQSGSSMGQAVVMAITLPLPVRVAAGILGAGIDLLRALPDDIPAIPVTVVGNAMRLSMKVQQEIAALATRGDELLGGVIGAPQESPAWATFDDDEPVKPVTPIRPAGRTRPATGSGPKATPVPGPGKTKASQPASEAADSAAKPTDRSEPEAAPAEPATEDAPTLTTPETTAMPPVTTTAMDAAIEVPQSVIDSATVASEDAVPSDAELIVEELTNTELIVDDLIVGDPAVAELTKVDRLVEAAIETAAQAPETAQAAEAAAAQELAEAVADQLRIELPTELTDGPEAPVIFEEPEELTSTLPIPEELLDEVEAVAEIEADADGPAALPDYDRMTLAQVRGHLRELSSEDVSALLRYEQDGDNRAPFLTLLSNRLVTLDAQHP